MNEAMFVRARGEKKFHIVGTRERDGGVWPLCWAGGDEALPLECATEQKKVRPEQLCLHCRRLAEAGKAALEAVKET